MFTDSVNGDKPAAKPESSKRSNAMLQFLPSESPVIGSIPSSAGIQITEENTLRTTETISPNEMQLVYDVQQNQYLSIHDIESNIVAQDHDGTYIDKNFDRDAQFQMITTESQRSAQPWASFWHSKHIVNKKLLKAISDGSKEQVSQMLNPH